MTLIAALSVLLVLAHILGHVSKRLGQPALLGHMVAGVLLGPSVFHWVTATPTLAALADLAVLFVVVSAGLEMRMEHMLAEFRGRGAAALLLGFVTPMTAGGLAALAFGLTAIPAMVVASIAYRAGLVDQSLFSALLTVGVVTTLITPLMLKRWLANAPAQAAQPH